MSQWAGIESTPTAPARASRAAVATVRPAGGAPKPAPLRRAERLVVGSIDGAAHVLQRRARDVLLGSALFMVPVVGVGLWLSVLAYDDFSRFDQLFSDRGYIGAETGRFFFVIALQSLTAHLVGAYATAYLVRYRLGGTPRIRDAASTVVRRLPLLLASWVLTHWWAALLTLAVLNADAEALGGIIMFLVPLTSLASAVTLLAVPVMIGERVGLSGIGRGWRLVRTRFSAAWGFVLSVGVLGLLIGLFIGFLPSAVELTGFITFGKFRWLAQGVAAQLAILVVVPFAAFATAEFYLQMRMHAEGLDITVAADRAFGTAT